MLAVPKIRAAMKGLGLTQAALATRCEVSPEAVSNWLKAESIPRPGALLKLSEALRLPLSTLLDEDLVSAEPVVAFRTRQNRAPPAKAVAAAVALGEHLQELLPYVDTEYLIFKPAELTEPNRDESYVRAAALRLRHGLGIGDTDPISIDHLLLLHRQAGSLLVPVMWGGDKQGHENALSVYLPRTRTSWVLFNLNCKVDDFKYWLAHELGHCYSLHTLRDKVGEDFSEAFAKALLCPDAMEERCWERISGSANRSSAAYAFAKELEVSVVTVVRGADRYAKRAKKNETGLETKGFYAGWTINRGAVPSIARVWFGTDTPKPGDYVRFAESVGAPVFSALARWQAENGKSATFIASALNIGLADAVALADVLSDYVPGASSPKSP